MRVVTRECALLLAVAVSCGGCGAGAGSPTPIPQPTPPPSCVTPARPPNIVPDPPGMLPCPTESELAVLDRDVAMSFEGDTRAGSFVCHAAGGSRDLNRFQERAYQALLWMRRSRFDAPLQWTGESLYGWFTGTVRGIRFRSDIRAPFCCDPPGVINLTGGVQGNVDTSIPGFPLEVMLHEARHIDFGPHRCGTLDNNSGELGPFGVQYSFMLWIAAHYPAVTPQQREWALNRAAWLRSSAFCQECE
jgi:hypothetical protein